MECRSHTQYIHTYESTYITETFTKLSWKLDKVDKNELNLIEKNVCTAYDLHNRFRTNGGNQLRFLLFTKSSDNKLRSLPPIKAAPRLHILRSLHAASRIWGVTLQLSDQLSSLVDCRWKYFKGKRIDVDWVFSCKLAAYFQNTYSQEHKWMAASAQSSCEIPLYFSEQLLEECNFSLLTFFSERDNEAIILYLYFICKWMELVLSKLLNLF